MEPKKLIAATLASSVVMWLVAGLWHKVVVPQFYKAQTHAGHEGTFIIFMAYLVLGLIMTSIYPRFASGAKPWITGLKFGALIGILWVFPHELAMAGAHADASIVYVFKNAAWHIVEQSIGGVTIAMIYAKRHDQR